MLYPRVQTAFRRVRALVPRKFPHLAKVAARTCGEADLSHEERWRLFMHVGHRQKVVCFAKAAEIELGEENLLGMFLHEFGHEIAKALRWPEHEKAQNPGTPDALQMEADIAVVKVLGFGTFGYDSRSLQRVDREEFEAKEKAHD